MTTRIERNKAAAIDQAFYSDGVPADADGDVTVTITRADGTALVTDAATTKPPATNGVYRYSLAPQADLDILTLVYTGTWSGTEQSETQTVEIVGDFYLSLAELRALPNLGDAAKFTAAEFITARQWFEDTFEHYTGVAWVPRFGRVTLNGSGTSTLILPHLMTRTVLSVTTYTTAAVSTPYTADELAGVVYEGSGVVRRWPGYFYRGYRYVVAYEHGHDRPPSDVVEAAKIAIRDRLLTDQTGNRVFAVQTQDGIIRTSQPGEGRPFGIPEVDAVANRRSTTGNGRPVAIA